MSSKPLQLQDLPSLLRVRRRELGLTQRELGELLGIDQRTVSALEKNPASVSVGRLFAVLEALKLHVLVQAQESEPGPVNQTLTVDQFFRNSRII